MKKLFFAILLFGVSNLIAQQQKDSILVEEITTIQNNILKQQQGIDNLLGVYKNLEYRLGNQNKGIDKLEKANDSLIGAIDNLSQRIKDNSINVITLSNDLGVRIKEAGDKADTQISQLDNNLDKNRLYWIIATLILFLLGGLIYLLLHKRISSSKIDVETQIRDAKASIEEESVKLDNKLVEVLETQLKLKTEEAKAKPVIINEKTDHSLALKVADEIIRIQKNLNRMDESTKGLKQLSSSVKRIQDNFAANGYELVDMVGKEYNEGMKSTVNFVQDENFEKGKRVITRIIKPQVNFNGEMIQTAQIEVTEA